MIKKRYMILSFVLVSVLFGSLFYVSITSAGKPVPQPDQVEIINFPLDEEGNLRTSTVQTSEIMLVFNETITVPSSVNEYTYITSFNTSGFRYAYIMAKGAQASFQEGANVYIHIFENNFGMQTIPYGVGDITLETGSDTSKPSWGTGTKWTYELHSTSTDLYLKVYNSNIGFDGLLTIAVFLTK